MQQLSASNLAFFASLLKKKNRQQTGLTWVESRKVVQEALSSDWIVHCLILTSTALEQLSVLPQLNIFIANEKQFLRLSELVTPDGWGAILKIPCLEPRYPHDYERGLILQGINDPGNLGTLIRLADWFGLSGVWVDSLTADPYSPKVLRSSMGSSFRVPVHRVDDFDDLLLKYASKIVAADIEGRPLTASASLNKPNFILLGSESHGLMLGPELRKILDFITIPRFGQAESLNVALAAAIFCWTYWGSNGVK